MLRIFMPVKIQLLRPGLNPQTWVELNGDLLVVRAEYKYINIYRYVVPLCFIG